MDGGILISVLTPMVLALIMMGMGMSLTLDDFRRVFEFPKAVAVGVFGQLVALPVIGLALALAFELGPEMAIGLMIVSFCPGGATSNILSLLARGDLALSVSLTAISCFITPFTIPLLVNETLAFFPQQSESVQLPLASTLLQIVMITVVPICVGMLINHHAPGFSRKMDRFVRVGGMVFLIVLTAGIAWTERLTLPGLIVQAGMVTGSLALSCYAFGYVSGYFARLELSQRASICIEVGLQNSTLAMVITTVMLKNTAMAVAPMVYSIMMFAVGWCAVLWFNYRIRGQKMAVI